MMLTLTEGPTLTWDGWRVRTWADHRAALYPSAPDVERATGSVPERVRVHARTSAGTVEVCDLTGALPGWWERLYLDLDDLYSLSNGAGRDEGAARRALSGATGTEDLDRWVRAARTDQDGQVFWWLMPADRDSGTQTVAELVRTRDPVALPYRVIQAREEAWARGIPTRETMHVGWARRTDWAGVGTRLTHLGMHLLVDAIDAPGDERLDRLRRAFAHPVPARVREPLTWPDQLVLDEPGLRGGRQVGLARLMRRLGADRPCQRPQVVAEASALAAERGLDMSGEVGASPRARVCFEVAWMLGAAAHRLGYRA